MRNRFSQLLLSEAKNDANVVVLSGDHGYALFDALRSELPRQFLNVGVAEQGMVGYAAGLCRLNFKPIVYGLAAFVPMRVLEQIKIDVCHANLPVIFIGDGAGLVYTTLGASHMCGEDMAALQAVPNIRIYSPCDAEELSVCFSEARKNTQPAYIRLGKSDRDLVHAAPLSTTAPHVVVQGAPSRACLVATGSMVDLSVKLAKKYSLSAISVPRIKPFDADIARLLTDFSTVICIEEHSRFGGLTSTLSDFLMTETALRPKLVAFTLEDKFAERCGSYQYALSEHNMSDGQIEARLLTVISES